MNKKNLLLMLSSLILTLACVFLTDPFPKSAISTMEPAASTPKSRKTDTPVVVDDDLERMLTETALNRIQTPITGTGDCAAEITITGVDEVDNRDGTKTILVRIGIENTGLLWGQLKGPDDDWLSLGTESPTYLTTKDGSNYPYIWGDVPVPSQSLPTKQSTGLIATVFLPPGFATLGVTDGKGIYYYKLAFQIPKAQVPDTITIGGMYYWCIASGASASSELAHYAGSGNLPMKVYSLSADVADIQTHLSLVGYPYLVGSKFDLPDGEGNIEFTGVTRDENVVTITLNFTNLSSFDKFPTFNGYILGSSLLTACQGTIRSNCDDFTKFNSVPVQAGETQSLNWVVYLSKIETDLVFVYIHTDEDDFNKVYRVNP